MSKEPLSFKDRTKGKRVDISIGDKWAEEVFDCAWFNITGEIPEKYNKDEIVFLINSVGEVLIVNNNGVAKQAITCYASQFDLTLGLPIKRVNDGLSKDNKVNFWIGQMICSAI